MLKTLYKLRIQKHGNNGISISKLLRKQFEIGFHAFTQIFLEIFFCKAKIIRL